MNEFELQAVVMQARKIKPADKFVMLCILKNVNWSTWRGTVTLSYLSKKYDINRRTLSRVIQRLKSMEWITVFTKDDETIINVNISSISNQNRLDKMSSEARQNDYGVLDKMSSEARQNDYGVLDKMTSETRQNVYHNNIYNNNTINNNTDHSNSQHVESIEGGKEYYKKLYKSLYHVDIDTSAIACTDEPTWQPLATYQGRELSIELTKRSMWLGVPMHKAKQFYANEKKREGL
jgi:hypothetical protein